MIVIFVSLIVLCYSAAPGEYGNRSRPGVKCTPNEVCVQIPGQPCTLMQGFVSFNEKDRKVQRRCAAPMVCKRDWLKLDEGICTYDTERMPCLMNNMLGDCKTLLQAPNAYCLEGRCVKPPSFPGDHCQTATDCTSGATCENGICKGIPKDGLCTSQFRLCDVGLYCPNGPPGHSKCIEHKKIGETCEQQFNILGFLKGLLGTHECEPGSHCMNGRCVSNSEHKAGPGEPCTGHMMFGHVERHCQKDLYCHPHNRTCVKWPENLWAPCSTNADCSAGMECNCKIGGTKVCEVPGVEGLALYDFVQTATQEVHDCIEKHNCWRGQSAYPKEVFNARSCAWINCRKHMTSAMHTKFCGPNSLPDHRGCIMSGWCAELKKMMEIDKAPLPTPTASPMDMVEKLSPGEISGIIVGALALTLLVFFSGYIVGWCRNQYKSWKSRKNTLGGEQEFSKLDSLVEDSVEL